MTILNAERRLSSRAKLTKAKGSAFVSQETLPSYAPVMTLEPQHLEIALRVDLDARALDVELTHHVMARRPGARSLRLHGIALQDLRVEGEGVDHDYDGHELQLAWDEAFERGEVRAIKLRYRVSDPEGGVYFSTPSEQRPDAPTFAVTDHETERARYWLCTVDLPEVRPTLEWSIRAPSNLEILANGADVGVEEHDDGTKTAKWNLDQGCPSYLTCFAIGDFVRYDSEDVFGVKVAAFAPRSRFTEANLEKSFDRTSDMLKWLPEKLGTPYPYPKYFQFAAEGIGGAMENISLVSWDSRYLLDDDFAREFKHVMDSINLHEMSHMWFGDLIVCRDYAHAWLKESWATYMETVWIEHDRGKDDADYNLWVDGQNYMRESDTRYARPIVTRRFDSSFDMYDYHLYPGGAWRLHMLRKQLGEDLFWEATRVYVARFAGKVVETDDFRRTFEQVTGESLAKFFEQWFFQPGYPKLKGSYRYDAASLSGTLTLEQTQKSGEIGLFDFDIEVAWWVDGERQTKVLRFENQSKLIVTLPGKATRVRIDPDQKVLHRLDFDPGRPRLLEELESGDLFGRILAGKALAKRGKREDIAAISSRLAREPHWGVRAEFAMALGDAQSQPALEALIKGFAEHVPGMESKAYADALGRYQDPGVIEALVKRVEDLPPRAKAAAFEALGKQREDAPLETLSAGARARGFNEFAQGGALRGLGMTRLFETLETLREVLIDLSLSPVVRADAATGIATLATHLEKREREQAIEVLRTALRDSAFLVQKAAAMGLISARDRSSDAALRQLAGRFPRQHAVHILRGLRSMNIAKKKTEVHQRVEGLESKVRKLSDALEKAEAAIKALRGGK